MISRRRRLVVVGLLVFGFGMFLPTLIIFGSFHELRNSLLEIDLPGAAPAVVNTNGGGDAVAELPARVQDIESNLISANEANEQVENAEDSLEVADNSANLAKPLIFGNEPRGRDENATIRERRDFVRQVKIAPCVLVSSAYYMTS